MGEKPLENFAMLMPLAAVYSLNGYQIFGATRQEFDDFKKWFESQEYQQLQLGEMKMDLWIRYNDRVIDHVAYSIQGLFQKLKKESLEPAAQYGFRSFSYKLNK